MTIIAVTIHVTVRHQVGECFKIISIADLSFGSFSYPSNQKKRDTNAQAKKMTDTTISDALILEKSTVAIITLWPNI